MTQISRKQQTILNAMRTQPRITLAQAVELIGGNIYANKRAHVGAAMARMVKRKLIQRESPGVYTLPPNDVPPEKFDLFGAVE